MHRGRHPSHLWHRQLIQGDRSTGLSAFGLFEFVWWIVCDNLSLILSLILSNIVSNGFYMFLLVWWWWWRGVVHAKCTPPSMLFVQTDTATARVWATSKMVKIVILYTAAPPVSMVGFWQPRFCEKSCMCCMEEKIIYIYIIFPKDKPSWTSKIFWILPGSRVGSKFHLLSNQSRHEERHFWSFCCYSHGCSHWVPAT